MSTSFRFGTPLLSTAFHFGDRGGGVLVEDLPDDGLDGLSILKQWTTSADNGSEVMLRVTSTPVGLNAIWYEDGSLEASGADGSYTAYAQMYKDYVAVGSPQPINVVFSDGGITITVAELLETVQASMSVSNVMAISVTEPTEVVSATVQTVLAVTMAISVGEPAEVVSAALTNFLPSSLALTVTEPLELVFATASNDSPTESTVVDLEKALRQGVLDCGIGLPVALENVAFEKPVDGSPWVAVFIKRNQPAVATLGQGGQDEHTGFLQIDLNYPLDGGTAEVTAKEQLVASFFKAGRKLNFGATEAIVWSCGGPVSRPVGGYYRRSLTIIWSALIDR